jgi:N-acetyltransferase
MRQVDHLGPWPLKGRVVTLEPLEPRHHGELIALADADPGTFRHFPFDARHGFAAKLAQIASHNVSGAWLTYAVRRNADAALVGSTSYLAITPADAKVEIGFTWYTAEMRGTAVNPECKYLLLENAFGAGYNRVELKTDAKNARSRAAIRKLGAVEEGILRAHMWMAQGYFRDTVYFSILAAEWPEVKAGLEARLSVLS